MKTGWAIVILAALVFIGCNRQTPSASPNARQTSSNSTTAAAQVNSGQVGPCVSVLQYKTPDGRKLTASLEPSDCNLCGVFGGSTHDPWWRTSASPENQEYLGYQGGDGQLWFTKVHAKYEGGQRDSSHGEIRLWFEHRGPGPAPDGNVKALPEDKDPDHEYQLGFYGSDGRLYGAQILKVLPKAQPCFKVDPR